jgi:hypothetical protein
VESVDGEQIKQAYLKLSASERREVAHWILARELSGRAGACLQPVSDPTLTGTRKRRFFRPACILSIVLILTLMLVSALLWMGDKERTPRESDLHQHAIEEAQRPHSPTNLSFLAQHIGQEIIIRGVPEDSEIGYLYFSKSHRQALRLNLLVGGVVLFQSGELEEWVRQRQELEVRGVLEETANGYYQLNVPAQNHLKKISR